MEQIDGDMILNCVRAFYKFGIKSSNKKYILTESLLKSETLFDKAVRRNNNLFIANQKIRAFRKKTIPSPGTAGNCEEMAKMAAKEVIRIKSTALLCAVDSPGDHCFCVADYLPHSGSPKHVKDMFMDDSEGAWVIDPWMNISCRFKDYPGMAASKLAEWSDQGKHIIYRKTPLDNQAPVDPIGSVYVNAFFYDGPLYFLDV